MTSTPENPRLARASVIHCLSAVLLFAPLVQAASLGVEWENLSPSRSLTDRPVDSYRVAVYADNVKGYFYNANGGSTFWESSDGENWNSAASSVPYIHVLGWDGGYIGYNRNHDQQVGVSTNGIDWQDFAVSDPNFVILHLAAMDGQLREVDGTSLPSRQVWKLWPGQQWQKLTESAPWPQRMGGGFVAFKKQLWLLGGRSGGQFEIDPHYNDVWSSSDGVSWDLVSEHAPWAPRSAACLTVYQGKLWLMGGLDWTTRFSDLWSTSDGVTWEEVPFHEPRLQPVAAPLFEFKNRLWVIGGGPNTATNDIWSTTDGTHWDLAPSTNPWYFRSGMASVSFDHAIWLLGGEDAGGVRNDVWRSTDGKDWTLVTGHAPWTARRGLNAVAHAGALWVMAGSDRVNEYHDVWRSLDGEHWELLTADAPWETRYFAGAASYKGRLWIMGGVHSGWGMHDVWSSTDGANWDLATPAAPWPLMASFGCVEHRGRLFIVAGRIFNEDGKYSAIGNGVWSTTDGETWDFAIHTRPATPDRENPGLVSYAGQLWLSSGLSGLSEIQDPPRAIYPNDLWSSPDGSHWTEVQANAPWAGRRAHGFVVFDDKLWLLGGEKGDYYSQRFADVWSSSGTVVTHTLDRDRDGRFSLSELLRAIQLYNSGGYHCDASGEDGFAPGPGDLACPPHDADYSPQDFQISLSELLRLVQFFNTPLGYQPCDTGEDGFCPVN